jgi:hypothetical protein
VKPGHLKELDVADVGAALRSSASSTPTTGAGEGKTARQRPGATTNLDPSEVRTEVAAEVQGPRDRATKRSFQPEVERSPRPREYLPTRKLTPIGGRTDVPTQTCQQGNLGAVTLID